MSDESPELQEFIYPRSTYRGDFSPEGLVFNANLQEFAQRISYVCALETNGKITPEEAYRRVRRHWKDMKASYRQLIDKR